MKERGILYQGAMVRALLADLKTQTRRVVKPALSEAQWVEERDDGFYVCADGEPTCYAGVWETHEYAQVSPIRCPYGQPGDRLWVREAWRTTGDDGRCDDMPPRRLQPHTVWYEADGPAPAEECTGKLRPSMFMPRWASRITLEVAAVRVERLQDISEEDAVAEGMESNIFDQALGFRDYSKPDDWFIDWPGCHEGRAARESYRTLWNSINLPPSPVQERIGGKLVTVAYVSYPWSMSDFEQAYPGVAASGRYRGKPLTITPNPWVWVISFRRNT